MAGARHSGFQGAAIVPGWEQDDGSYTAYTFGTAVSLDRYVDEQTDFRRLSVGTQKEIIEQLTGRKLTPAARGKRTTPLYWRRPVDLSPELAVKLVHGLSEAHRQRLRLFAQKGGRVSMKDLLAATGDRDWRVLSYFQSVLTRRLRRLIEDPDKKAELIKWDFDATKWNADHSAIVDGAYYVSERTAAALGEVLAAGNRAG